MDKKYRKLFSKIGLWYGVIGALIFMTIALMGQGELSSGSMELPLILQIPFNILMIPFFFTSFFLVISGALGCDFKNETCFIEFIIGPIVAVLIVWGLFYLIGLVIDKLRK
jgi:hypothetical protein